MNIWKLLGKCEAPDDAKHHQEEERRKEDVRRRLRLLQAEVDVIKRNYK